MRRILTKFFYYLGVIIGYCFTEKLLNNILFVVNHLKAGLLFSKFKSCGKNLYIEAPVKVIGGKNIVIGNNCSIYARTRFETFKYSDKHTPELIIGDNVNIIFDCHIGCVNKVIIGNNVLIASKVFITDHYHGEITKTGIAMPPSERPIYSKGPVIIEDNVWIGEGVAIMPNITIGRNCIIGANSVVTKSFPQNSILAGVPAKLIKVV
ncbi:DapH/DapD/GlmU-related protein [Mucilaginibacter sp. PAMB04168]|uniref:acyltransferase n=1 Tax=Mucilaginibacter sp. PAMB04168 TaxID=3138567 RepID=UPI0031F696BE